MTTLRNCTMKSINWHQETSQVVVMNSYKHQMWVPCPVARFYRTIHYNIYVLILILNYEVICRVTHIIIIIYTIWTIWPWYHKFYDAIYQLKVTAIYGSRDGEVVPTRCSMLSHNFWKSACPDVNHDNEEVIKCVVNMISLTKVRIK